VLTIDYGLSNVEQNIGAAFMRTMQVLAGFLFCSGCSVCIRAARLSALAAKFDHHRQAFR
jgi:hypothetical protein